MKYALQDVERFPAEVMPGVLYRSKEFQMCAHRCACGCGDIIQLPIDRLNYSITEHVDGPTLRPSVGNWNICNAHYFITRGGVDWMPQWTPAQIAAGRAAEDARRENHYVRHQTRWQRLRAWLGGIKSWFSRSE